MSELKEIAELYQPLFNHMSKYYGLTMIQTEMDAIIDAVDAVNENFKRYGSCDVQGCFKEVSSGGVAWKDTGYWNVCQKHGQAARNGEPQPEMKNRAVRFNKLKTKI